jgi:hypothetical protein
MQPAGTSGVGPFANGALYGADLAQMNSGTPAYNPNAVTQAIYGSVYAPTGTAAYYNTGQAYQKALSQAQSQVDPFYNQQINAFNTSIAAQQQQANQQQQLTNAGIQSSLQNTLQGNQIAQQRVGQDTSTALSNMANAQQNYKQTEGLGFDIAQRGLSGQLGAAGTAESGGGQQQVQQAQTQEQLGQQAQGQQYQVQRAAQQLFANRSFEDIARSSSIAGTQAGQQTQQAQLSLQEQLTGLASQQQQQDAAYQQAQKQQELAQASANYDVGLNNFFNSLQGKTNPYNLQATYQAYRPM